MTDEMKRYPTVSQCEQLWAHYHTPPHVIAHCKGVTEVAVRVAMALNDVGYQLSIPLIQSAGLLHDLLRVEEDHGVQAAFVVEKLGYADVADIIRVHMSHQIPGDFSKISELELVCLGDRVVLEDQFVGLDRRMQYIIDKSKRNGHIGAEPCIRKSFSVISIFVKKIEMIIGKSLEELMK